jgi:hypothetical protein
MGGLGAFLWATLAGLAVSVMDYAAFAGTPRRRRHTDFTDPAYLLKFIGHPLAGGLLAAAYAESRTDATPLVAAILGAAAPGIWRTIVRSAASIGRLLAGRVPAVSEPRGGQVQG